MSTSGVYFKFGRKITGFDSITTSGGTTTLTTSSNAFQIVSGSANQTIKMPDATSLAQYRYFNIVNNGTGTLTIQDNAGGALTTINAGAFATIRATTVGTQAGSWDISSSSSGSGTSVVAQDKLDFLQGMSNLNYNDGTNITFPISFNSEEIGANYWLSKTDIPAAMGTGASFVLGGHYYITCGNNGSNINTTNRYSDDDNYWLSRTAATTAVQQPSGFALSKGYKAGGYIAAVTAVVESYDAVTNAWSSATSLPAAKGFAASFDLNNYGYVVAGSSGSNTNTNYVYNESATVWYSRALYPISVSDIAGESYNGFGYGIGGSGLVSSVYRYNCNQDSWSSVSSLSVAKRYVTAFEANGALYCAAGNTGSATNVLEEYFDFSNIWRSKASSSTSTGEPQKGKNSMSGLGYKAGGYNGASYISTVEQYRNSSSMYLGTAKRSKLTPTLILAAAQINGVSVSIPVQISTDGDSKKLVTANTDSSTKTGETLKNKFVTKGIGHMAGGDAGGAASTTSERYILSTNSWLTRSAMTGKSRPYGFYLDGYGFLAGGATTAGGAPTNTVQRYNEISDTYASRAIMSSSKKTGGADQLSGFGYAVCGTSVAGGGTVIAENDRYSNALDSWTLKTANPTARRALYVGRLTDRIFAVTGTTNGNQTGNTNVHNSYSDISDSWTSRTVTPEAVNGGAGFVQGDKMYVHGGQNASSIIATLREYDPQSDAWTSKASTDTTMSSHGSFLSDGYGYVAGGYNGSYLTTARQYNKAANNWASITGISSARDGITMNYTPGAYRSYEVTALLPSFIAGLGAGTWTAQASTTNNRRFANAQFYNGRYWTIDGDQTHTSEYLNTATNAFAFGPTTPSQRAGYGFVLLGFNYTVGNYTSGDNSNYMLDDAAMSWTSKASTPVNAYRIGSCGGAPLNGLGYVYGGTDAGGGTNYQFVQYYNPVSNSWTQGANNSGISIGQYPAFFSVGGFGYAHGDYNVGNVVLFNDATAAWTAKGNHPASGSATRRGILNIGDDIYSFGGGGLSETAATYRYLNVSDSWAAKTSLSATSSAVGGAFDMNIGGDRSGGSTGSTSTFKYSASQNKIVGGIGVRIEES